MRKFLSDVFLAIAIGALILTCCIQWKAIIRNKSMMLIYQREIGQILVANGIGKEDADGTYWFRIAPRERVGFPLAWKYGSYDRNFSTVNKKKLLTK